MCIFANFQSMVLQAKPFRGSKFYAESRYQCPDIFDLRLHAPGKTPQMVPWPECQPEASQYIRILR